MYMYTVHVMYKINLQWTVPVIIRLLLTDDSLIFYSPFSYHCVQGVHWCDLVVPKGQCVCIMVGGINTGIAQYTCTCSLYVQCTWYM